MNLPPQQDEDDDHDREAVMHGFTPGQKKYRVKAVHSLRQAFEWAASPPQNQMVLSSLASKVFHPDSKFAKSTAVKGIKFSRTARTVERSVFWGGIALTALMIGVGVPGALPLLGVGALFNLKCSSLVAGALTEGCVRVARALARNVDEAINGPDTAPHRGVPNDRATITDNRQTALISPVNHQAPVGQPQAQGGSAGGSTDLFAVIPPSDPRALQQRMQQDFLATMLAEGGDTNLADVRGLHVPQMDQKNCDVPGFPPHGKKHPGF